MAAEYTVNWSNDAIKPPLTILPTERNETATSLVLFGKGSPNYGEGLQENLIRMLENFANVNPPANPTLGQLWFDSSTTTLKIFDGTDFISQGISTEQPVDPILGSTWFDNVSGSLQVWNGTSFDHIATVETDITGLQTDLANHAADASKHITAAQNSLLDALAGTLTGAELNYLDGATSNIQAQIDGINATISGLGNQVPEVNPTTPQDGDIQVSGTSTAPIIKIYGKTAWRQVFPAQYA